MKTKIIRMAAVLSMALAATGAERAKPLRVPPPGITISDNDRVELQRGADALGRLIDALPTDLRNNPAMLKLLPDVRVYHKAVDWALRYDEFYRSNEVGLARALLKQGTERAQQLRIGTAPWLTATGLVVRGYISRIDGSVQPYGLIVPYTYGWITNRARRLDVWLHGRDNNLTELKFISDRQRSYGEFTPADTFVLHPYGRYCNAFKFAGEVDVFEAMQHVMKSYRIDDKRIALRGFSMGGAGVWHLAGHYPEKWAVAAPGAGFAETAEYTKALSKEPRPSAWEQKLWQLYDATDYAANFFKLPVVAYDGTDDPQRQAADMMERAMKAEGLTLARVRGTNVGHKYTPEGKKEVSSFVDDVIARGTDSQPRKIHFTTRTLRYNQGPSLIVTRLEKHWERADVWCDFTSNPAILRTTNIAAFRLVRSGTVVQKLQIDGQAAVEADMAGVDGGTSFAHYNLEKDQAGKWVSLDLQEAVADGKRHGLQGPIDDAFMESFLVVRPTGRAQNAVAGAWTIAQLAKATNDWRAQFRGDARVKDDSQVTDADIAANNLIIFGDPRSNRLLARIVDKLPIKWDGNSVRVGGKTFSAATHAPVLLFPNPLNPRRYVVLNSGFTFAAAGLGSNAQQTPKLPDYAVLNVEDGRVELADFFDEQWRVK